ISASCFSFQLLTFDFQLPSPSLPCTMNFHRGFPISHVRWLAPRRTDRNRPASRHPPQLLCPSFRFRHCCRPHLLRASPHRPRGNHRQTAPKHRRRHLLQRPSHRLSARPFRIRPRKYQPPIRLVLPARASLLQFRAAESALRPPRSCASLRPAHLTLLRRKEQRNLRSRHRPRLEFLPRAFFSSDRRHPRHPQRHLAHRPDVPPQAPPENRTLRRKARHRNCPLRFARGGFHHHGAHHLRHRPPPPLAYVLRHGHAQRSPRRHRRHGRARKGNRRPVFRSLWDGTSRRIARMEKRDGPAVRG